MHCYDEFPLVNSYVRYVLVALAIAIPNLGLFISLIGFVLVDQVCFS
jgi:hypothetical protein